MNDETPIFIPDKASELSVPGLQFDWQPHNNHSSLTQKRNKHRRRQSVHFLNRHEGSLLTT